MTSSALSKLRQWLKKQELDAIYLPRTDEYGNENLRPEHERIAWLTGFSGSAGTLVVSQEAAVLFVDGRYELQAKRQLLSGFDSVALREQKPEAWLRANLASGARVGCPQELLSHQHQRRMASEMERGGLCFELCAEHPVDKLWRQRPAASTGKYIHLQREIHGHDAEDKIELIRQWLEQRELDAVFISAADSTSWLLNIRSNIVPYSLVALARALVTRDGDCLLFADQKPNPHRLFEAHFDYRPSHKLSATLAKFKDKAVAYDPSSCPCCVRIGERWQEHADPCAALKARKNATEIEGMRTAHDYDCLVWLRVLRWLGQQENGVFEAEVEQKIVDTRSQFANYVSESFAAIIASGPNGASAHYRHQGQGRYIKRDDVVLIDSGAHYLSGTTDCTRTVAFGEVSAEAKTAFTQVLQAHIALARQAFPRGTTGAQLDMLARARLWLEGRDYQHGTGHGVGCCLNVHESPPSISPISTSVLEPGMILSIEPGYYQANAYGIRLENLYLVREHKSYPDYLSFQSLTSVPFDLRMIDTKILTPTDMDWLEEYNYASLDTADRMLDELTGESNSTSDADDDDD